MSNDLQKQIEDNALTLFDQASALQVTDDATCQQAEELLVAVKKISKAWVEFFEPMREAAEANKQAIMDKINLLKLTAPGNNNAKIAYNAVAKKASTYRQEQDNIRRAAAEKARQEEIQREEDARVEVAA